MLLVPLLQVLLPQCARPAINGITLWLGARVLRLKGQSGILDDQAALGAVEGDELSAIVVQVAAQAYAEIRVVVNGFDQVGELAAVLEVEEPAGRLRALGGRVRSGDEVDSGNQVNEQVAAQALAVVGEAAPAEKTHRIERPLGRAAKKRGPVDRFLTGVWRDGINPGPAGAVAVPIRLDRGHLAELARVVDLFGFGIKNRANALAADLDDAIGLVRGFDHRETF